MGEIQPDDSSDSKTPKTPEIVYDHREEASGIPGYLALAGIQMTSAQLVLGDYVISDKIIVERKSANDLTSSIIDGRLFDQVFRLKQEYENPILLIEGRSSLNPAAVQGALVSVIRQGISVWNVKDHKEMILVLQRLALAEVKERGRPQIKGMRKKANDPEKTAVYMVATIPGMSQGKAEAILKHFGTLQNMATKEPKDFQGVAGIGKKTAENIYNALNFVFTEVPK